MATITEDELLQKGRELGTVEAAIRWMKSQGLTLAPNPIPPANQELPPVDQPQGGLSVGAEAQAADTAPQAAPKAGGLLDISALDFGNPDATLKAILQATVAGNARAEQSAKEQFEKSEAYLKQKYGGPSQADMFFALSKAMLSPRKVPGFKGFLGGVMGAFGDVNEAQRKAEQEREAQLMLLRQERDKAALQRDLELPKTAASLLKISTDLNKPEWVRSVSPDTGEVTLTPVYPGSRPPAGTAGGSSKVQPTLENTRYISNQTELIKLPPQIKFFIAIGDKTQTPRPIPGR